MKKLQAYEKRKKEVQINERANKLYEQGKLSLINKEEKRKEAKMRESQLFLEG